MRFGVGVRFPVPGVVELVGKAFARTRVGAFSGGAVQLTGRASARLALRPNLGSVPVITSVSFTAGTNLGFDALIGTIAATNSPTSFAITAGNPSGYFAVYNNGNLRTGLAAAPPDNNYSLTVTATNSYGTSQPKTISVTIGAAPVVINNSFNLTIPVASGATVGKVTTTSGTPTAFSITAGNSAGYFAINNAGDITVTSAGASSLSAQTYNLAVQATNALGSGTGSIAVVASSAGAYPDGSANAPTGTPNFPNLFSGYVTRPPWQVAGVDYRVGINTGVVLKTPTTANIPAGCTLSNGRLAVDAANVVLDGFDFTASNVWIYVVTGGNNLTITNCKFRNITQDYYGTEAGLTIRYCEIDNQADEGWPFYLRSASKNNHVTIEYCWLKKTGGDWIDLSGQGGGGGDLIFRYNIIQNNANGPPGIHGDWLQDEAGAHPQLIFDFNLAYWTECAQGTQGWMIEGAVTTGSWSNNTIATTLNQPHNFVGGCKSATSFVCRDNYVDPNMYYGGPWRGDTGWDIKPGIAGTTFTGNINLRTGGALSGMNA
ncbi:right-handed parallel beta-helix repeat-containing protein [Bradyrhizobium liaoningense]|uniref:right-handed parallel beta-helix repeat-containing protein n=1 Tax=Bradyrhizobium liaoningense TaxID=43992 RepID=UPI001BAA64AA|nr:right-handed parallel beta-helix repeat-containing protein [Bradyrhizobium liaoningense]MBR0907024.1 hypothetical protein [Bradyrhizobium liaoningense]